MTSRTLLNLGSIGVGYNTPLINRWLASSETRLRLTGGSEIASPTVYTGGYLDPETSELVVPCPSDVTHIRRYFVLSLGNEDLTQSNNVGGRTFNIAWDGEGTGQVNLNGGGAGLGIWNNPAGTGTVTLQATPGNTELSIAVTNPNNPPRNIRMWETTHDAEFQAGELFNPDWYNEIKDFHTFRIMDWSRTNGSEISEFDHIAGMDCSRYTITFDKDIAGQPRGSIPLGVVAALANKSGKDIHYCIPHMASDACITQIAEYFRDNISGPSVLNYEYSNEVWNSQFSQFAWVRDRGNTLGITTGAVVPWTYYGYRASEMMKIVRDVYGADHRSRWRGVIGTQNVGGGSVTPGIISGINQYRSAVLGNSLAVNDLFNEIAVTGYYGEVPTARTISAITQANPGVVTTAEAHGFSNGQEVYIDISANSGMVELNEEYVTVANATSNTFELSGVDTSGYTTFTLGSRRHVQANSWPRLYDASLQKSIDEPETYLTQYQYAAEIIRDVFIGPSPKTFIQDDGVTENQITCGITLKQCLDTYWPSQKALADANGLDLAQYEGGFHLVGTAQLTSNGGERKFTEIVICTAYEPAMAETSDFMHRVWFRIGGIKPSKFNCSGVPSAFGSWMGMRFYPGDDNPAWENIKSWNSEDTPKSFLINLS